MESLKEKPLRARRVDKMTREEALKVKEFRVAGKTWRSIASLCFKEFPEMEIVPGNQLYGLELCREAGDILGEDNYEW